jgi:hypothetical protein
MKTIKLKKGARLLKPELTAKIGGWKEMTFDAELPYMGDIAWLRVKNGMGGANGPDVSLREDWVANVPCLCISVHDYQWMKGLSFGPNYGNFQDACLAQLKRGLDHARFQKKELQHRAKVLNRGIHMIEHAVEAVLTPQNEFPKKGPLG